MTPRIAASALALGIAVSLLAGCGKAGKPEYPEGTIYPLQYPDKTLGPAAKPSATTQRVFVDPSVAREHLQTPGYAPGSAYGTGRVDQVAPIGNDLGVPDNVTPLPYATPSPPVDAQ